MPETQVPSLVREDPLKKGKATHSSILAWEIPWTEEAGGLQPMDCKESDMTVTNQQQQVEPASSPGPPAGRGLAQIAKRPHRPVNWACALDEDGAGFESPLLINNWASSLSSLSL